MPTDPPAVVTVCQAVEDDIARIGCGECGCGEFSRQPRAPGSLASAGCHVGRCLGTDVTGKEVDRIETPFRQPLAEGLQKSVPFPVDLTEAADDGTGEDQIGLECIECRG